MVAKPRNNSLANIVPIYASRYGTNRDENINEQVWNSQLLRMVQPVENCEERLIISLLALERFDQGFSKSRNHFEQKTVRLSVTYVSVPETE
jgi:hypothetical protein